MMLFGLYLICLILVFLISYFWTHFGILILLSASKPVAMEMYKYTTWGSFRREEITSVWAAAMILMTLIQIYLFLSPKLAKIDTRRIMLGAILGAFIAGISYNFLSSDIFTYLFASKTVTFFKSNPYTTSPIAFEGKELWLAFTLYVDNVYYNFFGHQLRYAYGPIFLLYSLIPFVIFSADRFLGVFFGLKLLNVLTFLWCGWMIYKINGKDKKMLAVWMFNPFLQLELLTNAHNDLLMIGLFVASVYLGIQGLKGKIWQLLLTAMSIGTKFVNFPLVASIFLKGKFLEYFFKLSGFGILFYHAFKPLHPWYYSWVYMVFPFAKLKKTTWILMFVLETIIVLLNYHKFMLHNQWGSLPFLPQQSIFRWTFPLLMLISEFAPVSIKKIWKQNRKDVTNK